jgi:hypothetical protein
MKVLFFLRRIGPYHHARFGDAARHIDLTVVETRPSSQEYPWQFKATGKYGQKISGHSDSGSHPPGPPQGGNEASRMAA